MKRFLIAALLFLFPPGQIAHAQSTATVVLSCGSLPISYKVGASRPITVDINGQSCISGTINATTTEKSTAAAPSYVEGTSNPLSGDLTGNLRVFDSQVLAAVNAGVATPGAAPPANIIAWGALGSGATGGLSRSVINCDQHIFKHITTATDTLIVQGVAGQTVFVCSSTAQAAGTATYFLENTASVNANCASANTQISGLTTMAANGQYGFYSPFWGGLKNTAGNGLCANSTGTGGFDLDVWWAQF